MTATAKKIIAALGALVAMLAGAFLFEKAKKKDDDALIANTAALTKVTQDQAAIDKNNADIAAQAETRKDDDAEATKQENDATGDADFFNNRK